VFALSGSSESLVKDGTVVRDRLAAEAAAMAL